MASEAQVKFIDSLLIDVGYSDRKVRNTYLSAELKREIHYVDDLSVQEASMIIDQLKDLKDQDWERRACNRNYDRDDC